MEDKTIKTIEVSIIVPVLNEEKYIKNLIESILYQDYNHEFLEILFIDGDSDDHTVDFINEAMKNSDIEYKVLSNPQKKTPISVNIGIKSSNGNIIIRLDGHSYLDPKYVSKCVYYLEETKADNVGCLIDTYSTGIRGKSISNVLSSKFGVGNSGFRTNAKGGYVDTVPFGCFRKELFETIGYFNEKLLRSEDNEFNSRITRNGGKIYLFTDINTVYYPRNTINGLMKMAYANGKEGIYTGLRYPGSMRIRHFIPLIFVLSIISGIIISFAGMKIKFLFYFELLLYSILDFVFSVKNAVYSEFNLLASLLEIFIYPVFHICYGIGSIVGIITYRIGKVSDDE